VPVLKYLEGDFLAHVRAALEAPAFRARGLFRDEYVARLVAAPNDELTPLKGNKLWQLGLLALWFEAHGI
jgi:asparagine synthase (glutamine-hydrolysing)